MNDLDITQAVSRVLSKYTKTTAPAPEQHAPAPRRSIAAASTRLWPAYWQAGPEPQPQPPPLSTGTPVTVFCHHGCRDYCGAAGISSIATAQCRIAPALLTAFASFPAGRDFARALDHGGGRDRNGKLCRQDGENRVAAQNSGVEDLITAAISGDGGLTLTEYSAYGVIGSITPTTNPTETIINNTLGMLAAGNAVVFSPHPRSRQVSLYCVTLINQQLARLGAPPVWWSRSPARRLTTPMP